MKTVKVTASTLSQLGPGTLIKAFDKLAEVDTEDEKIVQALELQTKIEQELERRGWTYDESIGDWVYSL